jgi:paraquat-inducible protein B
MNTMTTGIQQINECRQLAQQLINQTQQGSQQYHQMLQQEQQNAQMLEQLVQRERLAAQNIQRSLEQHDLAIRKCQEVINVCNQLQQAISGQLGIHQTFSQPNPGFHTNTLHPSVMNQGIQQTGFYQQGH